MNNSLGVTLREVEEQGEREKMKAGDRKSMERDEA